MTATNLPPPPSPPATAVAAPEPGPGWTGWFRFRRGRWQQGPTCASEGDTWQVLRDLIRQAGSPPHAEALVLREGKRP